MSGEIQRVDSSLQEFTPSDVLKQITAIQELMNKAMKKDEHYGIIPGCGDKPALFKAGAEKLSFMFRLYPEYIVEKTLLSNEHREYEVTCKLTNAEGKFIADGVGICTTMESKFRYRNAALKCPVCGKEAIIKGKAEYGGGWICYKKKNGCGEKFEDNAPEIINQEVGKIENENLADQYNTVKKMAKKRAFVDAIITATAASDIFTQDIEDLIANGVIIPSEEKPKKEDKNESGKQAEQKKTSGKKVQGNSKANAEEVPYTETKTEAPKQDLFDKKESEEDLTKKYDLLFKDKTQDQIRKLYDALPKNEKGKGTLAQKLALFWGNEARKKELSGMTLINKLIDEIEKTPKDKLENHLDNITNLIDSLDDRIKKNAAVDVFKMKLEDLKIEYDVNVLPF